MQESFEKEYGLEEISEATRDRLTNMKVGELRSLATEHGIDISGLKVKTDLVNAIALHPEVERILDGKQDESEEEEMEPSSVEEVEPSLLEEEAPKEPDSEAEPEGLNDRVEKALKASVDFSELEHFLSEAATRFSERNYDAALQTAKDSVLKIEEKVKDYVEASWAFAIASTQSILETSTRTSRAAKEAKRNLEEAREAFKSGLFIRSPEVLESLTSAALNLYTREMDIARDLMTSQKEALEEIRAMGGDIIKADAMLAKTLRALEENHRADYLDLREETDSLVRKAKEIRIEELRGSLAAVADIIEEGRSIGADVRGASNLLEDVKQAIDSGDFIAASELADRAEQAALKAQKSHIDKVARMRDQQVEKAKLLIAEIKPAIDRARTAGFQSDKALADLKAAVKHANAGDYVDALAMAKRSYGFVKAFNSQLEARKLDEEAVEPTALQEEPKKGETPSPPAPTCYHCGSSRLKVGKRDKVRCLDCGKKFRG
ncbi:MAG: hypothetical protein V3U52_05025 [Thermoplasmata archaeon]